MDEAGPMDFYALLDQVVALLQQCGRLSYRGLKLQFGLDDDYIDAVKAELIDAQQLAVEAQGTTLVWTGPAAPQLGLSSDSAPAPLSYTPPHLAEQILTLRHVLVDERKQVTVLLVDVQEALEVLADRDPQDARIFLDAVCERLLTAVHRFEGTVTVVQRNSLQALFGAPLAHEDHAVRACYAALAMHEAIRRYSTEVRRTHGLEAQLRVSLHTGEVVVRSIGDDLHMDYAALGTTLSLATGLQQSVPPGSIRLTAETLHLVEGLMQVTPLGPMPIRGQPAPVEVFELVGAGPTRRRLQAAATRGLTPFVGRQHELEALRQALERAAAGHGQVGALVGEPGVGKSRLVYEFVHSHRTQGWLVLESSSMSYGRATPYFPILDLLSAYFQIDAPDDGRRIREKVTGKLLTLDPMLGPTLPAFLALLDVRLDAPQWQALEPSQRRQRLLDAITGLLLRESHVQPVLLVFEDLHWIDAETQSVLDTLVESLPTAHLLLLVNYRPEYQSSWGHKAYHTQLRLDPLPPATVKAFLYALLGADDSLAPLTPLLMARTEGNPFFLEESVRTFVEMQVLVGTRGAYRLLQTITNVQVPTTVQALLAARIDRLPPEDKRLLQTAAVIGTEVPFPLLQALAECPEATLQRGIMHLQSAAFLHKATLFPELEYSFEHALTHEVAYGSLGQERRCALHARIVESLEALQPERLTEQVERLAQHAMRGEIWDKALVYCRQASARAATRSAYREVVGYTEQALMALHHLPEGRERHEQTIDLQLDLHYALSGVGAFERMLAPLHEAERLAETLADHQRLGLISLSLGRYYRLTGDQQRALASSQRALALAAASEDTAVQVLATLVEGQTYHALSDYLRTIECLRQNMTTRADDLRGKRLGLLYLPIVTAATYLAWALAEVGEFAEGLRQGEAGLRAAEEVDHHSSLSFACLGVGIVHLHKGDLHRAMVVLERSLTLCQNEHFPIMFPMVAASLGHAYALDGRVAEALPLLEQAVQRNTSMGFVPYHARWLAYLGEAYLLAGRLEEAKHLAARALEYQERGPRAYALRLLGDIAAQHDPPEVAQAETAYQQAMTLADALGMRPLLAHCHLGLGTLYTRTGSHAQAHAEFIEAIVLYHALEMHFWLPQAEAALTGLS